MSVYDLCWTTSFISHWCCCRLSEREAETRWTSSIQTGSLWTTTWILAERYTVDLGPLQPCLRGWIDEFVLFWLAAVQTVEGSNPGALCGGGASRASERGGAARTFQSCSTHQEAPDKVQVLLLLFQSSDSLTRWLIHYELAFNSIHSYHQPSTLLGLSGQDSVLQQQEKIMDMSYLLASEASQKSRLVAGGWRLTVAGVTKKIQDDVIKSITSIHERQAMLTLRSICLQPELQPWTEEKHRELKQHNLLHSDSNWTNKITVCPSRLRLHTQWVVSSSLRLSIFVLIKKWCFTK